MSCGKKCAMTIENQKKTGKSVHFSTMINLNKSTWYKIRFRCYFIFLLISLPWTAEALNILTKQKKIRSQWKFNHLNFIRYWILFFHHFIFAYTCFPLKRAKVHRWLKLIALLSHLCFISVWIFTIALIRYIGTMVFWCEFEMQWLSLYIFH